MLLSKKFLDKRTGEIVTSFNILDAKYMEEIKETYTDDEVASTYMDMWEGKSFRKKGDKK